MGWYTEYIAAKYEKETAESIDRLYLENNARRNLAMAFQLGMIDWFQYLALCREIGQPSTVAQEVERVFALRNKKAA